MVKPINKKEFTYLLKASVSNKEDLLTISKELEKQIKSVTPDKKSFTSSIASHKEKTPEEKSKNKTQRIRGG